MVELEKLSRQEAADNVMKRLLAESIARALLGTVKTPLIRETGLQRLRCDAQEPQLCTLTISLVYLAALTHLAYLSTGMVEAELASIYLYSGYKLVSGHTQLGRDRLRQVASRIANAGVLLVEGRRLEGLAALGRCLGQYLPRGSRSSHPRSLGIAILPGPQRSRRAIFWR